MVTISGGSRVGTLIDRAAVLSICSIFIMNSGWNDPFSIFGSRSFCTAFTWKDGPLNLVANPGFEDGTENWTLGVYPSGSDGYFSIERGGPSEDHLLMDHGNGTWQACSQIVGPLRPGGVYRFSALFKTTQTHYGYINLHDRDWNGADGRKGKSFTTTLQGSGGWSRIDRWARIPLVDDTGNSTGDDRWSVILYSHHPVDDPSPVSYDDVELIEFDHSTLPSNYTGIEERLDWRIQCEKYTDGYPLAPRDPDMINRRSGVGISGENALVITGNRTVRNILSCTLPVKPETKYRLSARLRIENRTAYNYLDLDYPESMTAIREDIHTTVMYTRGIWSGLYSLSFKDSEGGDVSMLNPSSIDHPYISNSDVDWFDEGCFIQTTKLSYAITITMKLEGFDGSLLIDGIRLEEVWSFIDDRYLHIPINSEYQGMRIEEFSPDPLFVRTNAATYTFGSDQISLRKDGAEVGRMIFPSGVLSGLEATLEPGIVVLENGMITISIGADSSAIFKARTDMELTVEGPRPKYYSFEAGVIFSTDHSKGMLFAPIHPENVLRSMPYEYQSTCDYIYHDQQFEEEGLKNWEVLSNFSRDLWRISYSFERGGGFLTSVFPPKDFNGSKLHKEKVATAGIDLNLYPEADHSYYVQKFKERNNIILLWLNGYAASTNDRDPPEYYYLDQDHLPVSPDHPGAKAVPFAPIDLAGPYDVAQKRSMERLVEEAHRQGCKVIVYMTPRFYYTSDVDVFLNDLERNLEEFGLDGVYYDGYFSSDPLRNIELVRRTRDILGDRFYLQHNSWTDTVIRRSDHFRVPFYEAYADRLWVGEGVKKVDEETFRLNYCGMNVSNTASTLLSELRPVDYSLSKEESQDLAIPIGEQRDLQLKYLGEYRLPAFGYEGYALDKRFLTTRYFDASEYRSKEYALGRGITSGDGVRDICEDIYTSPADCAPVKEGANLEREGDLFTCNTDLSVAQWIVDGDPLYDLHLTFDGRMAKDDSDHRMSPSQDIAYYPEYTPPEPKRLDGRKVFEFRDGRKLFSPCDPSLDYTNRDLSCFAVIKRNDTSTGKQVLFSLNGADNFYMGIEDSKFTAYVRDGDLVYGTEEVVEGGYWGDCLRMQSNDADWQATYQRIGRLIPGNEYDLSAMFKSGPSHQAYINLFTQDWLDAQGKKVGKSFVPPLKYGNGEWTPINMGLTLPMTMDNGASSAGCEWAVILYGHAPAGDGGPILYDNVSLWDGSNELVLNGGFDSGLDHWTHWSYIAEEMISATSDILDGEWSTLGVVYDRPDLTLYVNGIAETVIRINISDFPRFGNYAIGALDKKDRASTFNGYIDDLFVSGRALSQQQVVQYHETKHEVLSIEGDEVRCIVTDGEGFFTANEFPRIDKVDDVQIDEDTYLSIEFEASDPNGDELVWSIDSDADWIHVIPGIPAVNGTPSNDDVGSWAVNVSVRDGHGGHDEMSFMVHVLNVNDPPTIITDDVEVGFEDRYYEVRYEAVDIDPTMDDLSWNLASNCSFLSIETGSGRLYGTPGHEDIGTHWVNISVSDGRGGSDFSNFTMTVIGTNNPPYVMDPPDLIEMDEDTFIWIDIGDWFSDPDGDRLHYTLVSGENITIIRSTATMIQIRPRSDWSGIERVAVIAEDRYGQASHEMKVRVRPVNDPPGDVTISIEDRTYYENGSQPAFGSAYDPDLEYGDILNFTWHSNISGHIGSGSWIDLSLGSGSHNVTLTVTDSEGEMASSWIHIVIVSKDAPDEDPQETNGIPQKSDPKWIPLTAFIALISISILVLLLARIRRRMIDPDEE
ncbi:MAG: hypothetical protein QCI82_07600 [Candidatus Thermoplasmatota archaeon]|nr:hypothetical protein [Candidatus Thermoplasmatota archaeon]